MPMPSMPNAINANAIKANASPIIPIMLIILILITNHTLIIFPKHLKARGGKHTSAGGRGEGKPSPN